LGRLDDDLARIVELVALASSWLMPKQGTSGVRSVPDSRPPLDVAALDVACGNGVLDVLERWERITREHFGLGPYGPASLARGATVKGCVDFLRPWLFSMAEDAKFPIDDLASDAKALRWGSPADPELGIAAIPSLESIDPDHDTDDRSKLKCPGDHPDADGRRCHAILLYDREHPSEDICCRRCGTTWTGARLLLLTYIDDTQTVWAYTAEIVDRLPIAAATLRQWGKRGHIPRRNSQYDIGAVYRRLNTPVSQVAEP